MDKILNLFAAINEKNYEYKAYFMSTPGDEWDFTLNLSNVVSGCGGSFNFEDVLPVLNDFDYYAIDTYITPEYQPSHLPEDFDQDLGLVKHEVEIKVKA